MHAAGDFNRITRAFELDHFVHKNLTSTRWKPRPACLREPPAKYARPAWRTSHAWETPRRRQKPPTSPSYSDLHLRSARLPRCESARTILRLQLGSCLSNFASSWKRTLSKLRSRSPETSHREWNRRPYARTPCNDRRITGYTPPLCDPDPSIRDNCAAFCCARESAPDRDRANRPSGKNLPHFFQAAHKGIHFFLRIVEAE